MSETEITVLAATASAKAANEAMSHMSAEAIGDGTFLQLFLEIFKMLLPILLELLKPT